MPSSRQLDDPRSALVQAGIELVAAEGLAAATLRNVGARIGRTTGSVTHHFPDHHALIVAMLQHAHEQAGRRMNAIASKHNDPKKRLLAVLTEALPLDAERRAEWRVWLSFWSQAMSDRQLAEENARRYDEWRLLLDTLLTPLVRNQRDRARAVASTVTLVDGLGLGLLVAHAHAPRDHTAIERANAQLRAHVDSIASGTRARASAS